MKTVCKRPISSLRVHYQWFRPLASLHRGGCCDHFCEGPSKAPGKSVGNPGRNRECHPEHDQERKKYGAGLGIQFLRHIERTRLLVHLVDVSDATGRDPVHDFETVMAELAGFSQELASKPMIVAAAKMDVAQDQARVASLRNMATERGLPYFEISSAAGQGIEAEVRHGRTRASAGARQVAVSKLLRAAENGDTLPSACPI